MRCIGSSRRAWCFSAARRPSRNICSSTLWYRTPPTAPCCAVRAGTCTAALPRRSKRGFRACWRCGRRSPHTISARLHRSKRRSCTGGARAKSSVAKSAVREATAQLRRGLDLLASLPENLDRKRLELDLHVTLTAALMGAKGYADPEVSATLERSRRLVTETGGVGTPLHFSVLYGIWVCRLCRRQHQAGAGPCDRVPVIGRGPAGLRPPPDRASHPCRLSDDGRRLPGSPAPQQNGRIVVPARRASRIRVSLWPGYRRQRALLFVVGVVARWLPRSGDAKQRIERSSMPANSGTPTRLPIPCGTRQWWPSLPETWRRSSGSRKNWRRSPPDTAFPTGPL